MNEEGKGEGELKEKGGKEMRINFKHNNKMCSERMCVYIETTMTDFCIT